MANQQQLDGTGAKQNKNEKQCPECGESYKSLGIHFSYNEDHRPELTTKQREIIIGSLLGDGGYNQRDGNFRWQGMIVQPYLKWLQNQFNPHARSITKHENPTSAAQSLSEQFNKNNVDCSQQFTLATLPHPQLSFCEEWGYSNGGFEINFPDNFNLTPTTLKIWYISDGSISWYNNEHCDVRIYNTEQIHRTTFLENLFNKIDISVTVGDDVIRVLPTEINDFFKYIGDPPTNSDAGFKYKWEHQNRDRYTELFETMKSQPYLE